MARMRSPSGVKRWFLRAPIWLYNHRLGGLLGSRLVLLNHIGRKSGIARQVVVEVVRSDSSTGQIVVCSGWGKSSQWYQNLLARPNITIQRGSHSQAVSAVFLTEPESGNEMVRYSRAHPRAARKLCTFMNFDCDGTTDGYRAVGEQLPFIRLDPR